MVLIIMLPIIQMENDFTPSDYKEIEVATNNNMSQYNSAEVIKLTKNISKKNKKIMLLNLSKIKY